MFFQNTKNKTKTKNTFLYKRIERMKWINWNKLNELHLDVVNIYKMKKACKIKTCE